MRPPPQYECGPESARQQLSRHLVGTGVELGPGHIPFPIAMPSTYVRYLDAWAPADIRDRFPEIETSELVAPDTICDFNAEGLAPVPDGSQDFAIASHVLEHLANPLRMLSELHRVVRPGGIVLILLPDRHNTFDKDRPPTPLSHLVEELEAGVTEVDDDHVEEFIRLTARYQRGGPPGTASVPDPDLDLDTMSVQERSLALLWLRWEDVTVPAQRRELIELHRKRSVHAHVWDVDEFFSVLAHGVRALGQAWELVDGVMPGDPGGRSDEFGFVLRRAQVPLLPGEQAARLDAAWRVWRRYRGEVKAELEHLRHALDASREEAADLRATVEELRRSSDELQRVANEAIGALHRLGQGRAVAPEEIRTVHRQAGGEAVPELIRLLLRYRNHPFQEGTRRQLGRVKRAVLRRARPAGR